MIGKRRVDRFFSAELSQTNLSQTNLSQTNLNPIESIDLLAVPSRTIEEPSRSIHGFSAKRSQPVLQFVSKRVGK